MRRALLMIVMMVLIGCDNANGGGDDNSTTPMVRKQAVIPEYNMNKQIDPVKIYLDDLSFSEAFRIEYNAKGEGHTFWWHGEEYITNLLTTYESDGQWSKLNWVRNSDDTDDHCRSNIWDDCGICDGKGQITWYIDRDGDGLGDPATYTKDCKYPSVDEE